MTTESAQIAALKQKAERGDAEAQYILGVKYYDGEGVPKDYAEAAKWINFAAEQGNAQGQGFLGRMYVNGRGAPEHHKEAMKWFRLAAEQGHSRSKYYLSIMYGRGLGVEKNQEESEKWLLLAAEEGIADAQYQLGLRSEHKRNPREAYVWFSLALANGIGTRKNGRVSLDDAILKRDFAGRKLKPVEIPSDVPRDKRAEYVQEMYAKRISDAQDEALKRWKEMKKKQQGQKK